MGNQRGQIGEGSTDVSLSSAVGRAVGFSIASELNSRDIENQTKHMPTTTHKVASKELGIKHELIAHIAVLSPTYS
jgi:hypothetical protein